MTGRREIGGLWLAGPGSPLGEDALAPDLASLTELHGEALPGPDATSRFGVRVPLLLKFLDATSVQVHPDDAQAAALDGRDELGKTEAWYVLDAGPEAVILSGFRDGVGQDVTVVAFSWEEELDQFATLVVPSATGTFRVEAGTEARTLVAWVPGAVAGEA